MIASSGGTLAAEQARPSNPARILIVEDESIVAHDLKLGLERMGYEVLGTVAYGEDAIERASEQDLDLVLMDVNLKGEVDGTRAAREIRNRYNIPVIFVTAFSDSHTLRRAKVAQPFGYVLKPFDENELQVAVEMALFKGRMERRMARMEGQIQEQRAKAVRADRMRSVGETASSLAHDLSQPLSGVRGMSEFMLMVLEDSPEPPPGDFVKNLREIVRQVDRMSDIVGRVHTYAMEAGRGEKGPVSVNDAANAAAAMVESHYRFRGIEVDVKLGADLPKVVANVYALQEAVLHLLSNARDVLDELPGDAERTIRLTTCSRESAAGSEVCIEVADGGGGIRPQLVGRVFEPFFTTKDVERSTGLGLPTARRIVEEVGGLLELESQPGEGTTARIRLPVG